MLTRREFTGVASCALCGLTNLVAAGAVAAGGETPPPTTPGVTRKLLSRMDGPAPGYETLIVEATIEQGVSVGRHTHPGIENAYILEGENFEVPIQGRQTLVVKKGDSFQIPPETPHAGGKPSSTKMIVLATYVVEKGKPLASPA